MPYRERMHAEELTLYNLNEGVSEPPSRERLRLGRVEYVCGGGGVMFTASELLLPTNATVVNKPGEPWKTTITTRSSIHKVFIVFRRTFAQLFCLSSIVSGSDIVVSCRSVVFTCISTDSSTFNRSYV